MTKLLVVEDEKELRDFLRSFLKSQGYETLVASSGEDALQLAKKEAPRLILLDIVLPGMDGFEVCRHLRQNVQTANTPIIMITARGALADKLTGFEEGADDYITKPFDIDELVARIETQLRHVEQALLSELTGLPGNTQIEQAIKRLVKMRDRAWAIMYVDIDNFKAYNDVYGFLQGNELIKATARIIQEVGAQFSNASETADGIDFVGHVGGDDFVVITTPEKVRLICEEIIRRFDLEAPTHYAPSHRQRGYIVTTNRRGEVARFPIVTVSIGVVTNLHRAIDDPLLVSKIAAEVKQKAKTASGSSYYVDSRR
ncbi:MAG: response regulator [Chloroflexi bacterium]|nr:response regulator [Chloroflexota bacterium]